jgi:hypothetical protein
MSVLIVASSSQIQVVCQIYPFEKAIAIFVDFHISELLKGTFTDLLTSCATYTRIKTASNIQYF